MGDILGKTLLGNSVLDYIICGGLFLLSVFVIKMFEIIIIRNLKKFAKITTNTLDDFVVSLIDKLIVPFLYFGVFYLSLRILALPQDIDKAINVIAIAVATFFVARLIIQVTTYFFRAYWEKTSRTESLEHSLKGILKVIKFTVWSLAIIFFLDNLGFKISAVIAGLGIGGVAIALAAQAVLKDLFSYFSIIFDRPFEIGDFIIVGDLLGTVENIGIKTTRIRSLGGEQLVFSNSDLTDSRLRNYKRMQKRRVVFKLGVTYNTPLDKLREIPKVIETIIKNTKDTVFDRAHFFEYGDFNLVIEVVYYVLSSDYNIYMDKQQEINFAIKGEFEKREIEFAFPTQTVYLAK